jgi:hypothetical protein
LFFISCYLHGLIHNTDTKLIKHQLWELWQEFLNNESKELTSHYTYDCEKNVVSFVVECHSFNIF